MNDRITQIEKEIRQEEANPEHVPFRLAMLRETLAHLKCAPPN